MEFPGQSEADFRHVILDRTGLDFNGGQFGPVSNQADLFESGLEGLPGNRCLGRLRGYGNPP